MKSYLRNSCHAALLIVVTALISCGGSGGGSDGESGSSTAIVTSTNITFSPAKVEKIYPARESQDANGYDVLVEVAVSGAPISEPVFMYLVDPGNMLKPGPLAVSRNAETGHYEAKLQFNRDKLYMTYTGEWDLKLCKDSECKTTYPVAGNKLPFRLTVTPPLQFTTSVNGIFVPVSNYAITVNSGDVVSLQTNDPVVWSPNSDSIGAIKYENVSLTGVRWTGMVGYTGPDDLATGSITATNQAESLVFSISVRKP